MKYQTLPVSEAHSKRRDFIQRFSEKSHQGHRAVMSHGGFYGASAYRRALWESFGECNVISRKTALSILSEMPVVFITWDGASENMSRNLQKSRLVQLSGRAVAAVLSSNDFRHESDLSPEDVYVFAPDLSRYVAFTHEYVQGHGYLCLTSISNADDPYISPAFRELLNQMFVMQKA